MSRSFMASNKYPTLYQVLFSPHTPYVPPQASPIAMFAWKQRIWIESTLGLVAMEPWEKYLVGQYSTNHLSGFVTLGFACFINCSNVPPLYLRLYDPRRPGHISSAIQNCPWIQANDHLPPRHDDATKHHISHVMNVFDDTSASWHDIYSLQTGRETQKGTTGMLGVRAPFS